MKGKIGPADAVGGHMPSSKMKCNSIEYLLQKQIQKGVAHEKLPRVKL
jgi:hypothetical protein